AFHKSRGDTVEFVRYPEKPMIKPDIIYVTSLFTYSWRNVHEAVRYYKALFPKTELILGGIYASLLPDHAMHSGADFIYVGFSEEFDNFRPDYSLIEKWGWKSNILFSSRGCIRRCSFCAIPTLEGRITMKSTVLDLIDQRFKKIVFWDNNILATSGWRKIFAELRELGYEVDFNQGLDARLVDEEVAEEVSHLKTRVVRLAYDNSKDSDAVDKAISFLSKAGIRKRKIIFYALFNYTDTPEDFLIRMKQLLRNGVVAYPMRYEPLCVLLKNAFVSQNWSLQQLNLVQQARRVIGYAGSLPPYPPLIEKLGKGKSFEEAFDLRPSLEKIERKLCIDEEEARLVYTYYKNHDLTEARLPLQSALLRIRAGERVEGEEEFPLLAESNKRREQRRLRGSHDWR
ncbi:hypothetical protein MUP77_24435, partial [Candidatus Bathyarchaeota archaeon]|nr:hypothetical protein [Candidatus Bathyarchaeota archaeon]